jgi:hypothetical protein
MFSLGPDHTRLLIWQFVSNPSQIFFPRCGEFHRQERAWTKDAPWPSRAGQAQIQQCPRLAVTRKVLPSKAWAAVAPRQTITAGWIAAFSARLPFEVLHHIGDINLFSVKPGALEPPSPNTVCVTFFQS